MSTPDLHQVYLQRCLELAATSAASGGGPFAALIVKNGEVISEASNRVTETCDPTAHAEVVAIRQACQKLSDHQLTGCTVYTSCEPCPMCLGAIYWARASQVYYAATRHQAAAAGFDDSLVYHEVNQSGEMRQIPFFHLPSAADNHPFDAWQDYAGRHEY